MFETEITELINKNLPAHVGEVLRKRLDACTVFETQCAQKDKRIADLEAKVREFEIRTRDDKEIAEDRMRLDKRIVEHDKKERQFEIDKAVLEVRKESMASRLQDNKELVLAVFANSRFKYQENISKTHVLPYPGGGTCRDSVCDSRTVEGEGDPPA